MLCVCRDAGCTCISDTHHLVQGVTGWGKLGLIHLLALRQAMAPHSSTLAWKIPWTEERGGLQSMGSLRVDPTERFHFHFSLSCIGEEMATHSSVLAWRIPGMGEPGGLPSMGSHRVGHD